MKKEEKNSNKCPICGRPTHKESKYCIFHASAEEKTEEEFKKALKEYVNKIKKEDSDYHFEKFIFVGDIDFKEDLNITVSKKVYFSGAIFKGLTNFSGVTFEKSVGFSGATFEGVAGFGNATFKGVAGFGNAIFEEHVYFGEATFKGVAGLQKLNFELYTRFQNEINKGVFGLEKQIPAEGAVNFWKATFKQYANFRGATFGEVNIQKMIEYARFSENAIYKENINLWKIICKQYFNFSGVTFEGDAEFKLKYLDSIIDFSEIRIFSGKKLSIKIINERRKINFNRAYLQNTYLDIELVEGVFIDFTDALLRNTKIEKNIIENHVLQEKEKKFNKAKEIYLLIKNNFHSIGKYEEESWAFKKEKDMERKSNCHFKTLHKWIWSCFLNGIFGYGIQPSKVIISAILIITLFAFLFMNPGISNIVGIEEITSNNFFDCIYFSTITFTTLGYGDFRPLEGLGRILAGSEAFIGAFMMALFVYTFARRTGGR